MAGTVVSRPRVLDVIGAFCAALLIGGVVWIGVRYPAGLPASRDAGAASTPVWLNATVILVVLVLTRLAPPRLAPIRLELPGPRRRIVAVVLGLLVFEALFVASWWLPRVLGEADYLLQKVFWYAVAGGLLVIWARRRGQRPRVDRPAVGAWPLLPLLVFGAALVWGPAAQRIADPGVDLITLAVLALITALTAGVLEEVIFRGWLQTRLRALGSGWAAVAISSVAFAGMHLGSHSGELSALDTIASVLANQGLNGVLLGYLALRYGRLWPCIVAHIGLNGLPVLAYLVGLP